MSTKLWSPFAGGSHKTGISNVLSVLKCPKRAALDKKAQEKGLPGSMYDTPVLVGSLVHEFLEQYYKGEPISVEVDPVADKVVLDAHSLAWHVFRRYRAAFPANEFGAPREIEVSHPQNDAETYALNTQLLQDFSCKFDLVIQPDGETCERLARDRDLVLLPDYYYIVDHKTMGFLYLQWRELFLDSIQFAAYSMAFTAMWPDRPFGGVIVNCIGTDRRTATHRSLLVPPPTPTQQAAVHHAIKLYRREVALAEPRPTNCHFPKVCRWLHNGCERS